MEEKGDKGKDMFIKELLVGLSDAGMLRKMIFGFGGVIVFGDI